MFINSAKIDALIIKYAVEHFFKKLLPALRKLPYNARPRCHGTGR